MQPLSICYLFKHMIVRKWDLELQGSNIHMLPLLQDKQKAKVKEKFDKCNKEKLLEFCDLLDIPIAKATTRKVCSITAATLFSFGNY